MKKLGPVAVTLLLLAAVAALEWYIKEWAMAAIPPDLIPGDIGLYAWTTIAWMVILPPAIAVYAYKMGGGGKRRGSSGKGGGFSPRTLPLLLLAPLPIVLFPVHPDFQSDYILATALFCNWKLSMFQLAALVFSFLSLLGIPLLLASMAMRQAAGGTSSGPGVRVLLLTSGIVWTAVSWLMAAGLLFPVLLGTTDCV